MNKEFFEAVRMLEAEKGVPAQFLCERIQQALVVALRNDYRKKEVVFCEINPETETMRVWLRKNVVDEIEDEDTDILLPEAQRYQSSAKVGDIIEIEMESREFSRVAAQTAKHVIRQGIREAERGQIMEEFQKKFQELVTAKVYRIDPVTGNAILEIGKNEALLPKSEQVPGEVLNEGDLIKVYVVDIRSSEKGGPKVMISRTHPGLVKRMFETEVPEIYDGVVQERQAPEPKLPFTVQMKTSIRSVPALVRKDCVLEKLWICSAEKKLTLSNTMKILQNLSVRRLPLRMLSA